MWRVFGTLARDDGGAVAPTVALSLFGLIACGGIAFDYARLAAMDTEIQDAADHAALAAASQLDRRDEAIQRATNAITAPDSVDRLAANFTRFANDGEEARVEVSIDELKFCKAFDDSVADTETACNDTDVDDQNATFVVVKTTTRTANYALTPILAVFSGSVHAEAVAGVESSICNVAPLLVCVPEDDFPTDEDIGRGLLLKPLDGVAGNYGLLDFGQGLGSVTSALMGFGLNGCQDSDDNETEPGTKTPVTDAVNTRMDVYAKNNNNVWDQQSGPKCDTATGFGCPSPNSSKDLVLSYTQVFRNQTSPPTTAPSCPASPLTETPVPQYGEPAPVVRGYDRDDCFYNAGHSCGTGLAGNIGNGNWDRAGYFATYHNGATDMAAAAAWAKKPSTELTRYDVYRWELDNAGARLAAKRFVSTTSTPPDQNGRVDYTVTTQCTYSAPVYGQTGYPVQKDRRVIPVVAANCEDLRGKGTAFEDYVLLRAFDIFLTEPSQDRSRAGVKVTDEKEIFGEVVGPAETVGGGGGFQYYTRARPYLVR